MSLCLNSKCEARGTTQLNVMFRKKKKVLRSQYHNRRSRNLSLEENKTLSRTFLTSERSPVVMGTRCIVSDVICYRTYYIEPKIFSYSTTEIKYFDLRTVYLCLSTKRKREGLVYPSVWTPFYFNSSSSSSNVILKCYHKTGLDITVTILVSVFVVLCTSCTCSRGY